MASRRGPRGFRALSAYRVTWIVALFDLPVGTKAERSRATKFRAFLLDEGFLMMQFSCYIRHAATRELAEAATERIARACPGDGKVDVIWLTDRQYSDIRTFRGPKRAARPEKAGQLTLF